MAATLLNPWALDSNGKIISIEHAHKGEDYRCPVCEQPMDYCKKGIGPRAHTDHFSHRSKTTCKGGGESEIHRIAKERIYNILLSALEKHRGFDITWTCPECDMDFQANLLKRATKVEMEHDLDTARPDVALLDDKGKTIVAIEVVFTHDIESNTLRFYDNNNIVVLRIVIHTAEECDDMVNKLHFPDSCNLCFNDRCKRGETMQVYRRIVGVNNKAGQLVGLTVALDNPFESEPTIGLQFTDTDKRNALAIAKKCWPNMEYVLAQGPEYQYVTPRAKQTSNLQSQIQYRPRYNHPTIDEIMHQRQVRAIRANYARRGKAAKKSGGSRRTKR